MEITRSTQFALRTALDLAIHGPGHTADIARRRGIPPARAGKIVQQLVRGGIVQTSRGAHGGVRLARAPERMTLRQVVEATEGPIVVARCLLWDDCPCDHPCPVRTALSRIQQAVEDLFDGVTVADLAAQAQNPGGPGDAEVARSPSSAERVPQAR